MFKSLKDYFIVVFQLFDDSNCFLNTGSLFKTRCMSCGQEAANYKSPICAALEGKG